MKKLLLLALALFMVVSMASATNVIITGNGVRLRYEPSLEAGVHCKLNKGTKLEYRETVGDWYKVAYDGLILYVSRDFASLCDTEATAQKSNGYSEVVVHAKNLRLRMGPGTDYPYYVWTETKKPIYLNHGEVLPYKGEKKNGFYKVEYMGTECWIAAKYVTLR